MKDMKRTKAEKKGEGTLKAPSMTQDDYPYGLRVRLEHESLNKLGMSKLPKVGDKLHLHAHAHVVSTEERSGEDGKKRRHVEVELRKMDLGGAPKDEAELNKGAKRIMDKALAEGGGKGNYDGEGQTDDSEDGSEA